MNTLSKTFCILPWIHIYSNADGNVLPCCIGNYNHPIGNFKNNTLNEIWNNENYKSIRLNMLEGKECKECSSCYEAEKRGLQSFRQASNYDYKHHLNLAENTKFDGSLEEVSLRYFDIRWSNICNFRCRSCTDTYSSSIATENKKDKIFIFAGGDNNENLYQQFLPHFENIEHFYFAGGEPLITDKHYDILKHLISIGKTNVRLSYNSNLSNLTFKGNRVTDLWNKFSSVSVMASLDSWGSRAEYIRDGTKWADIENNIRSIRNESPNIDLRINSVISVFNLYTIPDFINYLIDSNLFDESNLNPIFYNILDPKFYSANVIPNDLKDKILKKLSGVKFNDNINHELQKSISYLNTAVYDLNLHKKFLEITSKYDSMRNQNFIKTFPELVELFEDTKKVF